MPTAPLDDHNRRPRPVLHFAPARGWMNDPNGLVQWNGRVHLFFQHNPAGPVHANIAWGHASSPDLWRWQDHPVALEPDPFGPDRDGCFSGCTVVADGRPHLLYTGVNGPHQLPCLAAAADQDLNRWTRDPGNPVIASPPPGEAVRAFRDHSAWRDGPGWCQVVGGGLEDRGGALFLYRSADLRAWEYAGVWAAAADHGLDGGVWECPDVFVLGGTVVVIVSVCDAFGWLREDVDELTGPDRSRVGVMSLPRELVLDDGGALRSRPARELDDARRELVVSRLVDGGDSAAIALSARSGQAAEFSLTPAGRDATAAGLRLTGPSAPDVQIRVTAGGIEITEGGRRLTEEAGRADGTAGQVRAWYDGGVLEVFGPTAAVAVICHRDGAYDRLDAEISGRPGAPPQRASLAVWACGDAEG